MNYLVDSDLNIIAQNKDFDKLVERNDANGGTGFVLSADELEAAKAAR